MRLIVLGVAAIAVFSSGYLVRAYFEKPKTLEVPVERIITRTKYIDKTTGKPIEVVKEETKFDSEAQERVLKSSIKKQSFVSAHYGAPLDNLSNNFYGISYNKRVFNNLFLGASIYTNSSATINLSFEF